MNGGEKRASLSLEAQSPALVAGGDTSRSSIHPSIPPSLPPTFPFSHHAFHLTPAWLPGDSFRQQRMASWQPIMTPLKIIIVFICAGVCFIPTGTSMWQSSNNVSATSSRVCIAPLCVTPT